MIRKPNSTANNLPLILIAAGVVIIFAMLIWQFVIQKPTTVANQPVNANIPYAAISRTSLSEAKAALDSKGALFVDVRDLDIYNSGHVSSALSIPLAEIETRYRELDPNKWIITYCT